MPSTLRDNVLVVICDFEPGRLFEITSRATYRIDKRERARDANRTSENIIADFVRGTVGLTREQITRSGNGANYFRLTLQTRHAATIEWINVPD